MNIKRFPLALVAVILIVVAASATAASGPAEAQGDPRVDAIVMFDSAPGPAEEAQVRAAGGVITQRYQVLPILAVTLPEPAIVGLSHQPNVVSVQKERDDLRFHDDALGSDPELQWGANRIDAEFAHLGLDGIRGNGDDITGAGVVVAVLDTGIDTNHPEFQLAGGGNRIDSRAVSVAGRNPTSNVTDKNGHGTHTSGIIGAGANGFGTVGVAPEVTILPIQIAKGSRIKDSAILKAYDFLATLIPGGENYDAARMPQVVNMSYGGGSSLDAERDALDLLAPHMILVASAGNSSGGAVGFPAAYASVLAISSTTIDDTLSSFSSVGSQVAFAAPGSGVYSTYKDGLYAHMSGTSMSAPHVAGVAALVAHNNPSILDGRVLTGLLDSETLPKLNSTEQGNGLIDAAASLGWGNIGDDLDLGNRAPSVDAGANQTVVFSPTLSVALDGSASDPDAGDTLLFGWTVSGPSAWSLSSPTALNPDLTGVIEGIYTLELTATDGDEASDSDTVVITVLAAGEELAQYGVESISVERVTKGRWTDVKFTVVIVSETGPLEGAVVTADISRLERTFADLAGTTNANGQVVFTIRRAFDEPYKIVVTDVAHSDPSMSWDGLADTLEEPWP